ncbi:MAG TPA: clostripain-related cysteine peptidase [Syntrophales bacterium]|nr:clostripain-related cysteine peptidase [Syntrophales bacterium]HPX10979.1 clostripain-related cysteine peptidase [Syntrophales bacterium]HQB29947.1 clostripain-related cysteine peptidase [Syntrophales bacterium]HQN79001.1 clostripain-related cysteine peptidase [Syntrophales bacterium]HQQ26023.1 clostripain-related cysteine peptidase [Syntrophales bacterium]
MKRSCAFFALGFLFFMTACSGGGGDGGGTSPAAKRSWTFMVYLGADNNLSSAGVSDLNEMAKVGSDENVNIVVQAEFSSEYTDFTEIDQGSYNGDTIRYLVGKADAGSGFDLESGTSIGNVDMASPATLAAFIQWAAARYPADHYALVIWDHGAGWKRKGRGAVEDETSGNFMTLPDLAKGVRDSGVFVDVIDFDACLMGMYEVAYEFLSLTDYMVFSEETEPGSGNPYDTILAALAANPRMTPGELSVEIVERYDAYYATSERSEDVTKSAVDMSKIAALHEAMVTAAEAIVADFATVGAVIAAAQQNTQSYYYRTNHDLYDFFDYVDTNLVQGSVKAAAQAVKSAASDAVVANRFRGDSMAESHGIAVYAPARNQVSTDQVVNELASYAALACSQSRGNGWYDAVVAMMENRVQDLYPGGFAFNVEWDTDADVDLYVWEPTALYAPWMGQTTPNGTFSADSVVTGTSTEYYVADDYVEPGYYDVIINYYDNGSTANYANVLFHYYIPGDPAGWRSAGPVTLDLSNPYPEEEIAYPPVALNSYSDYWYVYQHYVGEEENGGLSWAQEGTKVKVSFKVKKKKPSFGDGGK